VRVIGIADVRHTACSYGGAGKNASSVVEKVAAAQLNRDGVAAIWLLHLAAAKQTSIGYAHTVHRALMRAIGLLLIPRNEYRRQGNENRRKFPAYFIRLDRIT
jgi:hypothetical protein